MKTYKIGNKEIEGVQIVPNKNEVYSYQVNQILYFLLEALSEKKDLAFDNFLENKYGGREEEPKPNKKCVTCGENDHDYCTPVKAKSTLMTNKPTWEDELREKLVKWNKEDLNLALTIGHYWILENFISTKLEEQRQEIVEIIETEKETHDGFGKNYLNQIINQINNKYVDSNDKPIITNKCH